jgi:hypothetical protein
MAAQNVGPNATADEKRQRIFVCTRHSLADLKEHLNDLHAVVYASQ